MKPIKMTVFYLHAKVCSSAKSDAQGLGTELSAGLGSRRRLLVAGGFFGDDWRALAADAVKADQEVEVFPGHLEVCLAASGGAASQGERDLAN